MVSLADARHKLSQRTTVLTLVTLSTLPRAQNEHS